MQARGGLVDPAVLPGRATLPLIHGVVDLCRKGYCAAVEPLTLGADDVADGETWEDVVLVDTALPGIDARSLGFSDSELDATDLGGAKLQSLFLVDCLLRRCNLANAGVRAGSARRVRVDGARLTGLSWTSGEIRDSTFTDCRADMATFEGTKLERVVFERCDLREVDFRQCRFDEVAFRGCDLSGADFGNARFQGRSPSELSGCTLDGLRGVDRLRGVAMPWADIVAAAGVFAGEIGVCVLDDSE
jgi:uncharacterized protein YjbI with pentapeptide repeats